jgi:hypothetical protein
MAKSLRGQLDNKEGIGFHGSYPNTLRFQSFVKLERLLSIAWNYGWWGWGGSHASIPGRLRKRHWVIEALLTSIHEVEKLSRTVIRTAGFVMRAEVE